MRPTCHLALTAFSISLDHAIVAVFSVADSHGRRTWALVSSTKVQVSYHGVNAHAAGAPWEGVNGTNHPAPSLRCHCPSPFTQSLWLAVCFAALDAVLQAFSNISMMRQQMKPTWRVRHTTMATPGTLPPRSR